MRIFESRTSGDLRTQIPSLAGSSFRNCKATSKKVIITCPNGPTHRIVALRQLSVLYIGNKSTACHVLDVFHMFEALVRTGT